MALDPRIPLMAQGIQMPDRVNMLSQAMQLQGLQQQNALSNLKMQEHRAAAEEQNALRRMYAKYARPAVNAISSPNGDYTGDFSAPGRPASYDYEGLENELAARNPKQALELREARAKTSKAASDSVADSLKHYRGVLDYVSTPDSAARWLQAQYADPTLSPIMAKLGPLDFAVQNIPKDPQAFEQWRLKMSVGMENYQKHLLEREKFGLETKKASETERHNTATERTSAGQLSVAQGNLRVSSDRLRFDKEQPKGTYDPTRGVMVDTRTGTAKPVTMPGGQPLPAAKAGALSPTMQKELFEADDTVQSGKAVVNILEQASKLNSSAYSGYGAKTRAAIRSNLPGESKGADATINLDNMMTGQALESLKLVFGGMPTEGERKVLLDMQASADKTPGQRKDIIDRAIKATKTRVAFNEKKAKALRDGTYLTQGVENDPIPPDSPPAANGAAVSSGTDLGGGFRVK